MLLVITSPEIGEEATLEIETAALLVALPEEAPLVDLLADLPPDLPPDPPLVGHLLPGVTAVPPPEEAALIAVNFLLVNKS